MRWAMSHQPAASITRAPLTFFLGCGWQSNLADAQQSLRLIVYGCQQDHRSLIGPLHHPTAPPETPQLQLAGLPV